MNRIGSAALIVLIVGSASIRSIAALRSDDQPAKPEVATSETSMASKFAALKAEYEAEMARCRQASEKARDETEANRIFVTQAPDDIVYSRKMVDLALTAPKTAGARDALLWVIDHPGRRDEGPFGDEFGRAVGMLIRHHGDDPEAVRIGLRIDNGASPHRDRLLYGFLAAAKSRESKGLVRLSLAQYLETKAKYAQGTREVKERMKFKLEAVMGPDGKIGPMEIEQSIED